MIKLFACVALCFIASFSAVTSPSSGFPSNASMIFEDSARVIGTATAKLPMVWIDNNVCLLLVVSARDDSAAGFANDSACVAVSYKQVFPLFPNKSEYAVALTSHPDTVDRLPHWKVFDSLCIAAMDTAAVYKRNLIKVNDAFGNTMKYIPGDTLKTLQTTGFGAFAYTQLMPDNSPAIEIRLTGKANNCKRGVGSMWKVRVYTIGGFPTKSKN